MKEIPGKLQRLLKELYLIITNSIAFYPAIIMLLFLVLSFLSISFDFSEAGKSLKSQIDWLKLRDSSTARIIASSIVTGIISLTVFSFTMVMVVLNQTASQMSNRILDHLIGSRFQQVVLGIYIGTIVYALFLLSTIRNVDSGIQIPTFSTYFLILLTIVDLLIFIYFLHYITQSVRYKVIIKKTLDQTRDAMEEYCLLEDEPAAQPPFQNGYPLRAEKSGIYTGFNKTILEKLCAEHDFSIYFMHPPGTFVLKGIAILELSENISDEIKKKVLDAILLQNSETIEENYQYGFRQLSEVAVKALSPGINDPGTAVLIVRALFSLLTFRMCHFHDNVILDKDKKARVFTKELSFENIFTETLLPIWDYGREDRMIKQELYRLLTQFQYIAPNEVVKNLLQEVRQVI